MMAAWQAKATSEPRHPWAEGAFDRRHGWTYWSALLGTCNGFDLFARVGEKEPKDDPTRITKIDHAEFNLSIMAFFISAIQGDVK